MFSKNNFWCIPDAFSKSFCNEVIAFGMATNKLMATTGEFSEYASNKEWTKEKIKKQKEMRDSTVSFLDEPWISVEIITAIMEGNKQAAWNFDLDMLEKIQFTMYNSNQHYTWHTDSDPESDNYFGKRKLSFTIQLSDPEEYSGGQLLIYNSNPKQKESPFDKNESILFSDKSLKKGTLTLFPSFLWHKVTPVIRGQRLSLLGWCQGPKFK